MTSSLEQLVLGGVALNATTKLSLEALSFTPAAKKPLFAGNANADGETLVEESHYSNATFDLQIRVIPASSTDEGLKVVGELQDALQSCERTEGGVELAWTPNESTRTYTAYALSAEVNEIPVTVDGDTAGWFVQSPVLKVKLICRPFLYVAEKTVFGPTESAAEPQQIAYVKCGGDVPAEAKAIITDKSSQDRRYFKYGHDLLASEAGNPAPLIVAASLVTTNFSGEAKTRAGAYSEEKVKRATAIGQPITMCGTGAIKHVGSFRIFGRVYAASEDARFRISYRNGDGPLVPLEFQAPQVLENFCDLDLGEVTFDEAVTGEQHCEIRVEVKSASGAPIELDLNYLELIPTTRGFGRARGTANNSPTKLLAYDTFLQTEGALTGKNLPFPAAQTWAGAGDAGDYTVVAAEDLAKRTETLDADLNTGRYAIAGTEEPTASKAYITIAANTPLSGANIYRRGVFLRYASTEKWLMAAMMEHKGPFEIFGGGVDLVVLKREGAGAPTELGRVQYSSNSEPTTWPTTLSLYCSSEGVWTAAIYRSELVEPSPLLEGQDAALATGGALAKGKGGFYDAYITSATPVTRRYDDFSLLTAEPAGRVCYSGKTCRLTNEGFSRQDSEGKFEGLPSVFRGAPLYLQPEGKAGLYNRLVLALRRTDADEEADTAVTDKHSLEVKVRERFVVPR